MELAAGVRALPEPRSRVRWVADIFLHRLPASYRGPHRGRVRTLYVSGGVRLRYRLNRGDLQSIREVWLDQTYRFPADLGPVRNIVDLGANIGLTSVYLAIRHKAQRVLSVEPVPSNAALVRENLALNGIDGQVIEAVVGPREGVAYFSEAQDSNLGHLADQGREVIALDISAVFDHFGEEDIDILKIDIEGAEKDLFAGDRTWLARVRSVMIEFHPPLDDSPHLIAMLEAEGFHHIPARSVLATSTSAFMR